MNAAVADRPRMLEGIKIVDLTSVIFGPYCTQILAEMGAEIVKVESPEGDPMRRSGKMRSPGMGAAHLTLNRGKRAVVLDLKSQHGKNAMRALIERADVFIHNVRGAAIERLGFGYRDVQAFNPALIYVHCVGYGSHGPYAAFPAYDDVIQAASGVTTLPGRVDGDPTPRYVPSTVADKVAGLHAAYATLGALVHRLRTGEGQHVEVPMFEAFTHFLLEEHLAGATFDPPVGTAGYRRQIEPYRQPFRTADGWISIVPYGDANWITVFDVLGRPDILERDEYASPAKRVENAETLYKWLGELTPARTTQAWLDALRAAQIPAMAVRDIADITDDPHLSATGFFRRRDHPTEGSVIDMRSPVRFERYADATVAPAARPGAHTAQVLAELGLGTNGEEVS